MFFSELLPVISQMTRVIFSDINNLTFHTVSHAPSSTLPVILHLRLQYQRVITNILEVLELCRECLLSTYRYLLNFGTPTKRIRPAPTAPMCSQEALKDFAKFFDKVQDLHATIFYLLLELEQGEVSLAQKMGSPLAPVLKQIPWFAPRFELRNQLPSIFVLLKDRLSALPPATEHLETRMRRFEGICRRESFEIATLDDALFNFIWTGYGRAGQAGRVQYYFSRRLSLLRPFQSSQVPELIQPGGLLNIYDPEKDL